MCSEQAQDITLTEEQRNELNLIIRKRSSSQSLVERAKIILLAAKGVGIKASVRELRCSRSMVRLWRRRWISQAEELSVCERLKDAPRPGHPPKFTAEQVCEIMALACKNPKDYGYILSHWSQNALAKAVIKEGIVENISQRQIGRFLKSGGYSS